MSDHSILPDKERDKYIWSLERHLEKQKELLEQNKKTFIDPIMQNIIDLEGLLMRFKEIRAVEKN